MPYAEIVASIASRSAGAGTRANIDEFTHTTGRAVAEVGGAGRGKAIIILNPVEPPMIMRDTVFCMIGADADRPAITASIHEMVDAVQEYVPGYTLRAEPQFDEPTEALVAEVGSGDTAEAWVGYHGHQNMSFGVANSVIAHKVGVRYVDGSLCALGARREGDFERVLLVGHPLEELPHRLSLRELEVLTLLMAGLGSIGAAINPWPRSRAQRADTPRSTACRDTGSPRQDRTLERDRRSWCHNWCHETGGS
ncbi:hypothetical protein GCM10023215_54600 [Pseudonocardia yuanmonensis]|uniref:Acetaldehyde dehydrogenase n=1 Tax=Pseudonocardia yuanmonensis TaxID=1095914 RepID=A0ABP8XG57_9PSEU